MKKFVACKYVCQECMAANRILWASEGGGTRECLRWCDKDDELWTKGLVYCPQSLRARKPERGFCLRDGMHDAVARGLIVVFGEKVKKNS